MNVSNDMTPVYQQRFRAYAGTMDADDRAKLEVPDQYKDEFDERPGVRYFTSGNLMASARLIEIQPFMAHMWFEFKPEENAVEASRMCVDPSIEDTDRRLRLVLDIMKQIVNRAWGKPLYITATQTLGLAYEALLGFQHVAGTPEVIVPPGKSSVYLYRLDLADPAVQAKAIARFGEGVVPK